MGLIEQIAEIRVQEKDTQFVKYLLLNTDKSVEEITSIVDVSVSFVEKVKESLCTN